jgi:hypothetical protein
MTTVPETNANPSVPLTVSAMQDIPLKNIQESKTNPQRQFDETKLAELAENIRLHGVLQPVLVRPLAGDEAGRYELARVPGDSAPREAGDHSGVHPRTHRHRMPRIATHRINCSSQHFSSLLVVPHVVYM